MNLTKDEAGLCLLAIERQHVTQKVLMKGDPWHNASIEDMKRLENKLIQIQKGE